MADITVDSITNTGDTGIFDVLMAAVSAEIETQYTANRITGTEYANVFLGSIQSVLAQSVQFALQEQLTEAQIDGIAADNLIKAEQLAIAQQELLIKAQELLIAQQDLALRTTEANRLRDTTEAELEKQWGYVVTRDGNDDLVLGVDAGTGRIDKEIEKMDADIALATQQISIAEQELLIKDQELLIKEKDLEIKDKDLDLRTTESNRLRDTTEAELEKQWGYDVTRDGNNDLVLGADLSTGRIDKELQKMDADIELANRQINLAEQDLVIKDQELLLREKDLDIKVQDLVLRTTEANRLRDTTEAELEKQWGYDVSRDVNNDLILGIDQGDGRIDKEIEKMTVDIELGNRQVDIAEHELVIQDQELQIKEKDLEIKEQDLVLRTTEANRILDLTHAELEKQWGYDVDEINGQLVLNPSTGTGKIDKELEALDIQIAEAQAATFRADTQLEDSLLTTEKQRIVISAEGDIKELQRDELIPAEISVVQQKIVGKKQSSVISE